MRILYVVPVVLLAVLSVALGVIDRRSGSPPAEAAHGAAAGAGGQSMAGAGLPDLVISSIVSNQDTGSPCGTPAGVLVTVGNQGDAASDPTVMVVTVQAFAHPVDVPAIPAMSSVSLYAPVVGIPSGDTYFADADPLNFVVESNEANNALTVNNLTVGSLPTCTPTPTVTPTHTPTVTPTPTGFSTQDTDNDGILGAFDNCPFNFNPGQENNDRNFIDNSPPYAESLDDVTRPASDTPGDVCDPDDDNDTLDDVDEFIVPCPTPTPGPGPTPGPCGPPPCTPLGAGTSPLIPDSDGDGVLDGRECELGTDPTSPSSKPSPAQCGPAGDTDGDKISDRIEYCSYRSHPEGTDSDADGSGGGKDGCEAASFNADRVVNSLDQAMLAQGIIGVVTYHANVDINKDAVLNSIDQGLQAQFILPPGQCPGYP